MAQPAHVALHQPRIPLATVALLVLPSQIADQNDRQHQRNHERAKVDGVTEDVFRPALTPCQRTRPRGRGGTECPMHTYSSLCR